MDAQQEEPEDSRDQKMSTLKGLQYRLPFDKKEMEFTLFMEEVAKEMKRRKRRK